MLYFTIACGIPLLSLAQFYLCLYLPLAVVWQASAVDRKILISPRFGACTLPPVAAAKSQINCLAICNTFMAVLCATLFTLTLTIWLWRQPQWPCPQTTTAAAARGTLQQPPAAVEPPASTTATCLNVSHIESAIKHTKWLRELRVRVCARWACGRGRQSNVKEGQGSERA